MSAADDGGPPQPPDAAEAHAVAAGGSPETRGGRTAAISNPPAPVAAVAPEGESDDEDEPMELSDTEEAPQGEGRRSPAAGAGAASAGGCNDGAEAAGAPAAGAGGTGEGSGGECASDGPSDGAGAGEGDAAPATPTTPGDALDEDEDDPGCGSPTTPADKTGHTLSPARKGAAAEAAVASPGSSPPDGVLTATESDRASATPGDKPGHTLSPARNGAAPEAAVGPPSSSAPDGPSDGAGAGEGDGAPATPTTPGDALDDDDDPGCGSPTTPADKPGHTLSPARNGAAPEAAVAPPGTESDRASSPSRSEASAAVSPADKAAELEVSEQDMYYGRSPLHVACLAGRLDVVQGLLRRGADPRAEDSDGRTALHLVAIASGDPGVHRDKIVEIAKTLLVADPGLANVDDHAGLTPLECAAYAGGGAYVVATLLGAGASSIEQGLFAAARQGRVDFVQAILENALVDFQGAIDIETGDTLLHAAASADSPVLVRLFLDAHVDIDAVNGNGWTAFSLALRLEKMQAARELARASSTADAGTSGCPPLHFAVEKRDATLVQRLLLLSDDRQVLDDQGRTPLHRAVDLGDVEISKLVFEPAAAVKKSSKRHGQLTPIHLASGGGPIELLELVTSQIDVATKIPRLRDVKGRTPVHTAAAAGMKEQLEYLTRFVPADVTDALKDKDDHTALHLAARGGHLDCARLLLEVRKSATAASLRPKRLSQLKATKKKPGAGSLDLGAVTPRESSAPALTPSGIPRSISAPVLAPLVASPVPSPAVTPAQSPRSSGTPSRNKPVLEALDHHSSIGSFDSSNSESPLDSHDSDTGSTRAPSPLPHPQRTISQARARALVLQSASVRMRAKVGGGKTKGKKAKQPAEAARGPGEPGPSTSKGSGKRKVRKSTSMSNLGLG